MRFESRTNIIWPIIVFEPFLTSEFGWAMEFRKNIELPRNGLVLDFGLRPVLLLVGLEDSIV